MTYFVKIDDSKQGEGLYNYLKTLNYVKVIEAKEISEIDYHSPNQMKYLKKSQIDIGNFNSVIDASELSEDITFEEALSSSEEWKMLIS